MKDLLKEARAKGLKAVLANEGNGQPSSLYMIDRVKRQRGKRNFAQRDDLPRKPGGHLFAGGQPI